MSLHLFNKCSLKLGNFVSHLLLLLLLANCCIYLSCIFKTMTYPHFGHRLTLLYKYQSTMIPNSATPSKGETSWLTVNSETWAGIPPLFESRNRHHYIMTLCRAFASLAAELPEPACLDKDFALVSLTIVCSRHTKVNFTGC